MTIEELKQNIEQNTLSDDLLIFINRSKSTFLIHQYINAIAKNKKLDIEYIDTLPNVDNIFLADNVSTTLQVYFTDTLPENISTDLHNIIIVAKTLPSDTNINLSAFIVDMPELLEWQISDFIYTLCKGADTRKVDTIIKSNKYDISKLYLEAQKLSIFSESERKYLIDDFIENNIFVLASEKTIFDFITALLQRDIELVKQIYSKLAVIDIEPTGVLTLLQRNLKKYIDVWLSKNPTPESTGLKQNQIWAINNLPRYFTADELINKYKFILSLDKKFKSGQLPVNYLLDYIIINFV